MIEFVTGDSLFDSEQPVFESIIRSHVSTGNAVRLDENLP
jgi:hypothetical protein